MHFTVNDGSILLVASRLYERLITRIILKVNNGICRKYVTNKHLWARLGVGVQPIIKNNKECNMKKTIERIVAVVLLLVLMATFFVACDRSEVEDKNDIVKKDNTKTQLYVQYVNGGFGRTWLDNLIAEFEEMYKDVSFETGKKGVQVMKNFTKNVVNVQNMKGDVNNVYLMEDTNYYDFIAKNTLLDITDIVTSGAITSLDASGNAIRETATIESKIPDTYKSFFNVNTDGTSKYYGLPLFETAINIVYNKDVFEEQYLYMRSGASADGFTEEDFADSNKITALFAFNESQGKSNGPDGIAGTSDDGLPATYADFRALLIHMKTMGVTPFVWNGYETGYLTGLINDMWANNVGAEQMMLNFTLEGTAKANTLVQLDNDGNIMYNDDGSVKLIDHDVEITADNAYMLHQQKGKLDALEFAGLIMSDEENYYSSSFDSGFKHTNAQDIFLNPDSYNSQPIAFLVEGGWWYKEMDQRGVFKTEAERLSYNYAILPLPKSDASHIGEPDTKVSDRKSMIFINNYIDEAIIPLAKAFVSFLQNDHALQTYTRYTDAFRAMNYTLTEETYNALSPFGKCVSAMRDSTSVTMMPWVPMSVTARKNVNYLGYRTYGFSAYGGSVPMIVLKDNAKNGVTYEDYFEAIIKSAKATTLSK